MFFYLSTLLRIFCLLGCFSVFLHIDRAYHKILECHRYLVCSNWFRSRVTQNFELDKSFLNSFYLWMVGGEVSKTLRIFCVIYPVKVIMIWQYVFFFFFGMWCLGTFIEDLLSARYCSKHLMCIKSCNPHSSYQIRCFSNPNFFWDLPLARDTWLISEMKGFCVF